MNLVFPTGFPPPTAFYLTLYVLTLSLHIVFMNYVLGGVVYLALANLFGNRSAEAQKDNAAATVLLDWLPFALGLAITAGVAPLLFIQILYQFNFYTANLLLFHRWMSILPVLIVAFYLLYLFRSELAARWPGTLKLLVSLAIGISFVYVAYSWTENHVLSRQTEKIWTDFYVAKSWFYLDRELLPRLVFWISLSLSTMANLVAWQLLCMQFSQAQKTEREVSRLSVLAMSGLALTSVCAVAYFVISSSAIRARIISPMAAPYFMLVCAGLLIQAFAWAGQMRQSRFYAKWLGLASLGGVLATVGIVVVRESIRVGLVPMGKLFSQHAHAAKVGGFWCFIFFFLLNAVLITACILFVKRSKIFVGPAA